MEIFKAANQWSTRPADERFETLADLEAACSAYKASAREKVAAISDLRAEAIDGDVRLVGRAGVPARISHWAFGQLATKAGAPASYLRELPATLAVQNLNHGLKSLAGSNGDANASLLFHQNGDLLLRAATSERYDRIWNADLATRARELAERDGWQVPPARPAPVEGLKTRKATAADVLQSSLKSARAGGLVIKEGDEIAPAGLYASDHDCFIFLVDEQHGVDDGTGHELSRGMMLWNSEVGASSLGGMFFLYDAICGNHIVWGAQSVTDFKVRHVGDANARAFGKLALEARRYANQSGDETSARIVAARRRELGATKEEALDAVFALVAKKRIAVTGKQLDAAYQIAEATPRYGSPRTAWAMANGLTELSQKTPFAGDRVKLDRAAGKLLEATF